MNIVAIAQFYIKHHQNISDLLPKGAGDQSLLSDAATFVKKHFPQYNPDNLIDDALALFNESQSSIAPAQPEGIKND